MTNDTNQPTLKPEFGEEVTSNTEANRRKARNARRTGYVQRLLALQPELTEEQAQAAFEAMEQDREEFIAAMLTEHPDWDRSRAAGYWKPLPDPRKPTHTVTAEDGWTIRHETWRFQRRLWRRYRVVLGFGEYRRLIKQAWIPAETPEQNRANYVKRTARVALDSGQEIEIILLGQRIFGLADEDVVAPPGPHVARKFWRLAGSLHAKYGIEADIRLIDNVREQITSSAKPVLTFSYERAIHRVSVQGDDEVYIMVQGGKLIEAKKREGVRKGVRKALEEPKSHAQAAW